MTTKTYSTSKSLYIYLNKKKIIYLDPPAFVITMP